VRKLQSQGSAGTATPMAATEDNSASQRRMVKVPDELQKGNGRSGVLATNSGIGLTSGVRGLA